MCVKSIASAHDGHEERVKGSKKVMVLGTGLLGKEEQNTESGGDSRSHRKKGLFPRK